jgi:TRAP-type uncharacterized transport system fused permease subunit
LALVGAFCAAYMFFFYRELATRPGQPTTVDLVVAVIGMVLAAGSHAPCAGPAHGDRGLVFLGYTFGGPYMPDLIAHKGARCPARCRTSG